ncbi:MAG: formylmethanofuran dehydrogenase subunit B [Candidatus Bathyarchaeota archaeon]|nr:MAG: formylmethanofuran dehydrogenase subunit B [Candidatus Bathyarchaeota archaeon]
MTVISHITCPVCGDFCDDIEVTVEDNVITDVKNACAVGAARFLNYATHRRTKPLIRKDGELVEASLDEAIRKSAEILADATYPLLFGWSSTSCEATRVGLELAEEVGGVIDNTSTICHGPSILGIQDIGISSCTLGQLRHRADLIFYWGSNPWDAHPRHIERYTMFTEGRFQRSTWRKYVSRLGGTVTEKRLQRTANLLLDHHPPTPIETGQGLPYTMFQKKRKMVVADVRKTRTAEAADYFLQVEPNRDYELLQAFRMLIRDGELDVEEVAGVPVELLEEVADVMIGCELGVFFFGLGLTMSEGRHRNIDAALSLVRDLNQYTKFLIMPMRGHFNVTGANVVFTWQTGYPFAVDLSQGFPRYNPGETSTIDILRRRESDAALVIGSDPLAHFPKKTAQNLIKNPLIAIDPELTPTTLMADVVIPPAYVGIEAEGTAYRMDHVPLPLKKIVDPPETCLSDEEILRRILNEVRRIRRKLN